MPKSPLTDKMASRSPKPFGDEGPPDMDGEDSVRGSAAGADDSGGGPPMPDDAGGPPDMAGQGGYDEGAKAVDDMADILGVGPEDRVDFGNALSAYVGSEIAKALAGAGGPPGGMPGGMPGDGGDMPPMAPDEDEDGQ